MAHGDNSLYETIEKGNLYSLNYRLYFSKFLASFLIACIPEGPSGLVSPWHDIPLYADKANKIFNMVVEIPRWSNAKMEAMEFRQSLTIQSFRLRPRTRWIQSNRTKRTTLRDLFTTSSHTGDTCKLVLNYIVSLVSFLDGIMELFLKLGKIRITKMTILALLVITIPLTSWKSVKRSKNGVLLSRFAWFSPGSRHLLRSKFWVLLRCSMKVKPTGNLFQLTSTIPWPLISKTSMT